MQIFFPTYQADTIFLGFDSIEINLVKRKRWWDWVQEGNKKY